MTNTFTSCLNFAKEVTCSNVSSLGRSVAFYRRVGCHASACRSLHGNNCEHMGRRGRGKKGVMVSKMFLRIPLCACDLQ